MYFNAIFCNMQMWKNLKYHKKMKAENRINKRFSA
nr:MAG TPA: hypothetical protein [Caudoviricetes sp.]